MPGCACGGWTRTSTSPSPPTAESGRPTCTAPFIGMLAQPASSTAVAIPRPTTACGRRLSDIGGLACRFGADAGRGLFHDRIGGFRRIERKRRFGDLAADLARQRQPEDTTLAGLPPRLQ